MQLPRTEEISTSHDSLANLKVETENSWQELSEAKMKPLLVGN